MTLKECYEELEGDYSDVIERLRSETLVQKFVLKFLEDTSYENIKKGIKDSNIEEAFRGAHTLKGVCQNLSFTKLYRSSNEVTEVLRTGNLLVPQELMDKLEKDYKQTISALDKLKE
jgi:HPt (histidine-containing phosphotransfer) domain-containing protein